MSRNIGGARSRPNSTEARAKAEPLDFKKTAAARAKTDPAFARARLDEGITLFVIGADAAPDLEFRRTRSFGGARPSW